MSSQPILETVESRLQLRDPNQPFINPIFVDFLSRDFQRRAKEPKGAQLLAKALGLTAKKSREPKAPLAIIDATAGLGTDSALMAMWGANVTALERSALVFALLKDGLARAQNEGSLKNMSVFNVSAEDHLETHTCDMIFLDPMYPDLKKTALPRKEMQILRNVLEPSAAAEIINLLTISLRAASDRVVIKRPPQAEAIEAAGRKPHHSIEGKAVRYDIYLTCLPTPKK